MSHAVLKRFEMVVTKDKSGTDAAQVPAVGATVAFYKQGATVSQATTVPKLAEDWPVSVYDAGELLAGDTVQLGVGPSVLQVSGIVSSTQITVTNNSNKAIAIPLRQRLIATTDRPTVYSTPLGTVALVGSQATTNAIGLAVAYVSRLRFDFIVSGTGISPSRVYADASGTESPNVRATSWLNAQSFPTLQAAIDALPSDGGVIFLPAATYVLTAGLNITKDNVTLRGEGLTTVIKPADADQFDLVTTSGTNFRVYNLKLDGSATSPGSKSCLVVNGYGVSGRITQHYWLENVQITAAPSHGMFLRDVILLVATNCEFWSNQGNGARIETPTSGSPGGSVAIRFLGCAFNTNFGKGLEVFTCTNLALIGCTLSDNRGEGGPLHGSGLDIDTSGQVEVLGCVFEVGSFSTTPEQFIFIVSCQTAIVEGCWFKGGFRPPKRAARIRASADTRFANNVGQELLTEMVWFDDDTRSFLEFGNREIGQPLDLPRIAVSLTLGDEAHGVSLSRRSSVVNIHTASSKPSPSIAVEAPFPGSLIWDTSGAAGQQLQLADGASWKIVQIT